MKTILDTALTLCVTRHAGQYDKGGMPYALHPMKVMHYLKSDDIDLMCVALLHDILEDTDTTVKELTELGFSDRVISAVKLLTKMPGQTADEYLDGIKTCKDAILVKMCDLRHNSDIRRLKGVTEKDVRRIEKYHKMFMELKALV